ncbi:hypothetical protein PE067_20625 [Paracoccus sp. DMF-8]|uniref:hypothetical protein n=1 Tax=Paracoccus sp. DMF-8 TaxID=3019445 RepID=UPI0023E3A0E9|nr:hypothetical protein [Paracoccus sp. DMF-8]MDF3608337.1 hypothetical protein [Paracoccus sp. DMF-8]
MESYDREVISLLYTADNWVDLYQLHETKLLSPGQLASTLLMLMTHELCEIEGMSARLTAKGRDWVFLKRKEIFFVVARDWALKTSQNPQSIDRDEPYLPDLSRLDVNFFLRRP